MTHTPNDLLPPWLGHNCSVPNRNYSRGEEKASRRDTKGGVSRHGWRIGLLQNAGYYSTSDIIFNQADNVSGKFRIKNKSIV